MFDVSGLDQQLGDARTMLREVRAGSGTVPQPEEVVTEAADGGIRVTLGTADRFTAIEINPTVLRQGSEYVAQEILSAVNAALDERGASARTGEPMPDLEAINANVERLQDESLRQMRQLVAGIGETMRKIHRS